MKQTTCRRGGPDVSAGGAALWSSVPGGLGVLIFVIIIFERNRLKEVLHRKDGHLVPGLEVKPSADRKRAGVP